MDLGPLLIKGPRIIDAASGLDQMGDILVVDGKIAAVGQVSQDKVPDHCRTVDATGLVPCLGENNYWQ